MQLNNFISITIKMIINNNIYLFDKKIKNEK